MLNNINISSQKQKLIIYVVLTVFTLTVFWQLHQYDFINIDDHIYVTENIHIKSGIAPENFIWAFSTTYAEFWHPLVWLSFMLDYKLYGLNAGGYHLTNLILHILSTLLLFWLFNRMTKEIWKSAFVAALFALHPLHVESVAWISERKDVLSAFFWMLTLCLYVYYTEKPVIRRYLFVIFSFVLALMSKPTVVTLPVIMILLDYWPLKRLEINKGNWLSWQLKEKIPFFAVSFEVFPLSARISNALISFVIYLEKTFWPHNLAVFYPFSTQIPLWQITGASLLIIIISATVIIMAKRLPYLFVGWLWYLIIIFPVIGIIQITTSTPYSMADRYHYLPSIGISIMLAWGIPSLFRSEKTKQRILFPVAFFALGILVYLTGQQCSYWKNSVDLWNHALKVTKNNVTANCRLADAYADIGQYERSIETFKIVIQLIPDYIIGYNRLGIAYSNVRQYKLAIENFNEAIRMKPDYVDAYANRSIVYFTQGNIDSGCNDARKACALGECKLLELAKGQGYCR
jgi:hypothetical protein